MSLKGGVWVVLEFLDEPARTWGRATLTRTLLSFAAIFLALVYAASSSSHVQQVGYSVYLGSAVPFRSLGGV